MVKNQSLLNRKIILLSFAVIIASILLIIKIQTDKTDNNDIYNKTIQEHLIELVGKDYFDTNFILLKTESKPGSNTPPLISNASTIHTYKFLPFSQKYPYKLIVQIDKKTKEIYQELPPCVYDKSPNRCNFSITYSQAIDKALEKLGSTNIKVTLSEKDSKYYWVATHTDGDPLCGATYTSFLINTESGLESPTTVNHSNFCI